MNTPDPGFVAAATKIFREGVKPQPTALDVFWDRCEGPIRFGANDCCIALADTILAAGGPDLMAGYRGRYRTARGFVRAFRREGHHSLHVACEAAFKGAGSIVGDPADFDVAVIEHFDLSQKRTVSSPAVFIGGAWLFRTDRGGAAILPSAFRQQPEIYRILLNA